MDYFFDRRIQKLRYVITDLIIHSFGKAGRFDLRQFAFDIFNDITGITAVRLLDHDGRRWSPVKGRVDIIHGASKFDICHIFYAQYFTTRI
ncbi:hypothetical protein D3C86_1696820 [compost metagenome]